MHCAVIMLIICSFIIPIYGQTYIWDSYTSENSPLPTNDLTALYWGNDGVLWIGSDSGLTGYNGSAWVLYNTSLSEQSANRVSSIRIDADIIWLGTNKSLLSGQIDILNNISWNVAYRTDNSELIHNKIITMNIDSLGAHWVCTDSGITIISDSIWLSLSTSSEIYLSSNKILSINQQPTKIQYIGTESGGVSRLYKDVEGISGASNILKQWTAFPDSTGRVQPGLLSDTVQAVLVAKNGDRWYGTKHGVSSHTGDFLKNPYSWRSYTTDTGLINNNVQVLAEDPSGAIWIGTAGGLSRLVPDDTTWTHFTVEDGLVSNNVRDISVPADSEIWIATDGGLSHLKVIPTAINSDKRLHPKMFEIYPAYPNPFNMSTTIKFQTNISQQINISIFDVNGRLVNTILNSFLIPGRYKVYWNGKNTAGSDVASGVYFVSVSSPNLKSLLKLVLIK